MNQERKISRINMDKELSHKEKNDLARLVNEIGSDPYLDFDFDSLSELIDIETEEEMILLLDTGQELGLFNYSLEDGEIYI